MKFLAVCEGCSKRSLLIYKRYVYIPQIKQKATSHHLICGSCARRVQKKIAGA